MTIFNLDPAEGARHFAKSPFRKPVNDKLRIENKADEVTIHVYDEISWWGVSAEELVKEINNITAGTIHLRLNSPGGSVFDGTSIYNAIKQHPAKCIVHVDGLAASIASVIAMAGDEIHMGDGAYMMIHEPWSIAMGTAEDMRKEADLLDKVCGTICQIYQDKCGKDEEEVKTMMEEETWMTADEAVAMGFADKIDKGKGKDEKKNIANLFDLSVFAKVPDALTDKKEPSIREIEKALRDVGCSNKRAKAILAKGFTDDLRDEELPVTPGSVVPQREVEPTKPVAVDPIAALLEKAESVAPKIAA